MGIALAQITPTIAGILGKAKLRPGYRTFVFCDKVYFRRDSITEALNRLEAVIAAHKWGNELRLSARPRPASEWTFIRLFV